VPRCFGDEKNQHAQGVSVDGSYNVTVAGYMEGQARFGMSQPLLTSAGGDDAFVASFDGLGQPRFSAVYGGAGDEEVTAIADADGDIIVGGSFDGCIDFGGGAFESDDRDGFVAKLSP